MSAPIPVAEMAETLRVLAGSNAGNAAHHFKSRGYETGDIASAALWSSIAEEVAFRGARFEDVEGDALALEERVLRFHREMTELASDEDFEGIEPAPDDECGSPAELALAQAA